MKALTIATCIVLAGCLGAPGGGSNIQIGDLPCDSTLLCLIDETTFEFTGSVDSGNMSVFASRDVWIHQVTVAQGGIGILSGDHDVLIEDVVAGGPISIRGGSCICNVTLRNVTIGAVDADRGLTITMFDGGPEEPSVVLIEDVHISGAREAMVIGATGRSTLRDIEVGCVEHGIWTNGQEQQSYERVEVTGCNGRGIFTQHQEELVMQDVTVLDSGIGIWTNDGSLSISATGESPEPNVRLDNITLLGNGLGLLASDVIAMTGSRIIGNGVPSTWMEAEGYPYGGILAAHEGSVHGSVFEGNADMAMSAGLTVFDATKNWWGHAQGPTPTTEGAAPKLTGDRIHPRVDFVPFLDARPN